MEGATCLWCENYVRMGYHFFLAHGQNTIENEEHPENPGGVWAAERAGCLMGCVGATLSRKYLTRSRMRTCMHML